MRGEKTTLAEEVRHGGVILLSTFCTINENNKKVREVTVREGGYLILISYFVPYYFV